MPNTFPALTGTGVLPDLAEALAGRVVLSETWTRCAEVQNHAHARGQLFRASQSWPGSICRLDSATAPLPATMAGPWRVPLLTYQHVQLRCRIFASMGAVGGGPGIGPAFIRFQGLAANVDIQVNAGAAAWYTGLLTLANPAVFDDVVMQASVVAAGEEVTVHAVSLAIEPLASPLAAGTVTSLTPAGTDTWIPHGITTLGPDYPLSSSRLQQLRESCETLYYRVRTIYHAVSLSADVQTYVGASSVGLFLAPRGHLLIPRLQDAADILTGFYVVWVYAERQAADSVVRIGQFPDGPTLELTVGAGVGPVWVVGLLDLRAARSACVPGAWSPHAGLYVYPGVAGDDVPHSTTDVYTVSIWGV